MVRKQKRREDGVTYQHPETQAEVLALESAGRLGARKLVICPDCGEGYKSGYGHPGSDWCQYTQDFYWMAERDWTKITHYDAAVFDLAGIECNRMLVDVTQKRGGYRGVAGVEGDAGPRWARIALEWMPVAEVRIPEGFADGKPRPGGRRRRERARRRALVLEALELPENKYAKHLLSQIGDRREHRATRIIFDYVRPALLKAAAVDIANLRTVSAKLQERFASPHLRSKVAAWRAINDLSEE